MLGAPLDVIVVRKLGVPIQPELAMGPSARGPPGCSTRPLRAAWVTPDELRAVEAAQRHGLQRATTFWGAPIDLGRTVVVVDDGMATGSTALLRQVAWAEGAARVALAVPVAWPTPRPGSGATPTRSSW